MSQQNEAESNNKNTEAQVIPISLISDVPVEKRNANNPDKEDSLDFGDYSRMLAGIAVGTKGPFSIGVYGDWGMGKTSLLQLTRDEVEGYNGYNKEEDAHNISVWYNAWQFEKEEHPIFSMIAAIIAALVRNKKTSILKEKQTELLALFNAIKVDLFIGKFNAKDYFKFRKEAIEEEFFLSDNKYFQAFDKLNNLKLEDKKIKIILFIDDLDRCNPENAVKLLESIKLILNQPGFIFFLGLSKTVIEGYLKKLYTEDYKIADFKGEDYLEKIVQYSFQIPDHQGGRIESFIKQHFESNQFDLVIDDKDIDSITNYIKYASRNLPRNVIRFLNSLNIVWKLANQRAKDISVLDVAIAQCLYFRWPKVYHIIERDHDKLQNYYEYEQKTDKSEELLKAESPEVQTIYQLCEKDDKLKAILSQDDFNKFISNDNKRKAVFQLLGVIAEEEPKRKRIEDEDFSGQDLSGKDFSLTDFYNCNFEKTILNKANFFGAKLRGAKLSDADLIDADLRGAKLSYANLRGADLSDAKLRSADLRSADLSDAKLRGAKLSYAKLSGAYLRDATGLSDEFIDYARKQGAILDDSDLEGEEDKT